VRVPSKDPLFVSRELNGGGMRVIVIYIRPVQDAKDVIAAANFQLLGHRSLTNDMPQFQYHHLSANAMNVVCNRVTLVISMMETFEAVDCVEELAAVENVDSLLIGTNNMCAKLGIQCEYKNPRLTKVHEKAIAACKKHSKRVGVGWLHSRLDIVERFCATGARWVTAVTDGPLLLGGATKRAHEMAHLSARVKELKQQKLMSGGATDE
jgi:2-keto-3-deoxy-L-rhamnonate aldolase RhmA